MEFADLSNDTLWEIVKYCKYPEIVELSRVNSRLFELYKRFQTTPCFAQLANKYMIKITQLSPILDLNHQQFSNMLPIDGQLIYKSYINDFARKLLSTAKQFRVVLASEVNSRFLFQHPRYYLIFRNISIEKQGELHLKIHYQGEKNGNLGKKFVEKLISQGFKLSIYGNYMLQLASKYGYLSMVNYLLRQPKVDPRADDYRALRWANEEGHTAVAERLFQDFRVNKLLMNK